MTKQFLDRRSKYKLPSKNERIQKLKNTIKEMKAEKYNKDIIKFYKQQLQDLEKNDKEVKNGAD